MASFVAFGGAGTQVDTQIAASDRHLDGHAEGCDLGRMPERVAKRMPQRALGAVPPSTRCDAASLGFIGNGAAPSHEGHDLCARRSEVSGGRDLQRRRRCDR
jgi:hypothetical protein